MNKSFHKEKSPYLLQMEIIKRPATKVKIANISVFGMKQKSYIHLCDAVQGIESLTFVTKDDVQELLKLFLNQPAWLI